MDVQLFLEEFEIPTSYEGRGSYQEYKKKRFLGRLQVMLALYLEEDCCESFIKNNGLVEKINTLSAEDKKSLKNSFNPAEMLNLFVDWKGGKLSFYAEDERLQLNVAFESSEYLLQESFPRHRSRCKKREELIKAKNSLALSVLRDLIEKGIIM